MNVLPFLMTILVVFKIMQGNDPLHTSITSASALPKSIPNSSPISIIPSSLLNSTIPFEDIPSIPFSIHDLNLFPVHSPPLHELVDHAMDVLNHPTNADDLP